MSGSVFDHMDYYRRARNRRKWGFQRGHESTLMSYTPGWTYPVLFVVTFIGGILGALLGKAVLKKHFEKAGIA